MICCNFCGQTALVVRLWRFHTRPGNPTVPRRCDVHLKCTECAAGWWHGVGLSDAQWHARPRPTGLRAVLSTFSLYEPGIFNGARRDSLRNHL